MKKIKLCLLLIVALVPFKVFALDGYYDSVKVETTFASDVDIKSVGNIIIEIKDADNNSYEFELTTANNYSTTIKDLFTYSDLSAETTLATTAYSGDCTINYDDDKNPVIKVSVSKNAVVAPASSEAYSEEEIETAKQKVKNKEIRYTIYKYIFGIILGIILGALCIAGRKIVNANK